MKHFMSNPCGYGNCLMDNCDKCSHYTPTCFGIRVPRWLGNILFALECKMMNKKTKGDF